MIALLGAATAITVLARQHAGAGSRESFLARAQTRSGLVASTVMLDYRSASVTLRTALPALRAERRWFRRRPRQARWAILWRDALALGRDRARAGWASALMAAGTWELVTHPGRPLPAVLGAVAIYFAAARLSEPLRIDVDVPERSRLMLGWTFARVLVAHCLLPALLLAGIGAATIVGLVIVRALTPAALALAPTLLVTTIGVAVLTVSLAARRRGRIDPSWLNVDPSNPLGWALLPILIAPWLLVEIAAIGGTALLVGHAAAHGSALLATAVGAVALSAAIAGLLLATARRSQPPE
ncbi:MAG: hypothetical protein ACRDMX_03500 [Solirubrobacteraceae bacterium]